nr:pentatricopeptide repeat-containing protein At1g62680, mitochondrial-like [Coffea arabica]
MARMRPLPSVAHFNRLMGRIVKMKQYLVVLSLYRDAAELGCIPLDEYTLNIVINCYCFLGKVNFGFSIFGGFFKRGILPNTATFTTLLKGLFWEHKIHEAQGLFKKIIYEKLCVPNKITFMEKGGRCRPHTAAYNTIIDGLCKDKMMDQALSLLHEMIEKGIAPNVITYSCLVRGLCNLSKWKDVEKLLTEMKAYSIVPNVITFNILIDALCKEGQLEGAEEVLKIMIEQNQKPDNATYSALMDGYCLQGRMDEAKIVFDKMAASGLNPDVQNHSILINGYMKKMKVEAAMSLFQEIRHKGLTPNVATYNTVLQGLFSVGRYLTAIEVFDEMRAAGIKPDFYTYCVLLNGLCKNSHVEEALQFLHKMEVDGVDCQITMYNIVLDGLCKCGKLDSAQHLFYSLSSKGLDPDVTTYNTMINGLFSEGFLEEAKEFIKKMEENGCTPNLITFNIIVQGLLKAGELNDAVVYFDEMDRRGFSLHLSTFSLLLDSYRDSGNDPSIFKIIEKFAQKMAFSHPKVHDVDSQLILLFNMISDDVLKLSHHYQMKRVATCPFSMHFMLNLSSYTDIVHLAVGNCPFTFEYSLLFSEHRDIMEASILELALNSEGKTIKKMRKRAFSVAYLCHKAGAKGTATTAAFTTLSFLSPINSTPIQSAFHSAALTIGIESSNHHQAKPNNIVHYGSRRLRSDIDGISNLDEALGFYKQMVRMKPLPSVVHFNRLLGRIVKMKQYLVVLSLSRDMAELGCVKLRKRE